MLCTFVAICMLFSEAVGPFSRSRLRGTQSAPEVTTARVQTLTELRAACSARPSSPELATFRDCAASRRVEQGHGKPFGLRAWLLSFLLCCSICNHTALTISRLGGGHVQSSSFASLSLGDGQGRWFGMRGACVCAFVLSCMSSQEKCS